jgi:hypothetical protein
MIPCLYDPYKGFEVLIEFLVHLVDPDGVRGRADANPAIARCWYREQIMVPRAALPIGGNNMMPF